MEEPPHVRQLQTQVSAEAGAKQATRTRATARMMRVGAVARIVPAGSTRVVERHTQMSHTDGEEGGEGKEAFSLLRQQV